MPDHEDPDRLLTRRDVERRFALKARFLELAALRGEGPPIVRVGRSVFYRVRDVRAWIEAQLQNSGPER